MGPKPLITTDIRANAEGTHREADSSADELVQQGWQQ